MSAPTEHSPSTNLEQRFQELAAQWRLERGPFSTARRLAQHPAYRKIVALGEAVVPFILADLEKKPDHWFLALEEITGASPVPESDWGKLPGMAAAWIAWGLAQGYRW